MNEINIGDKFGKLTLRDVICKDGVRYFKFECDCGNKDYIISEDWFIRNNRQSCGKCYKYDMIGKRFGSLLVVALDKVVKSADNKHAAQYYKCKCDCGGEIVTLKKTLESGNAVKCGKCLENKLVGAKINHWTLLSVDHKDNKGRLHMLAKCDCGNEKVIQVSGLKYRSKHCEKCYNGLPKSNDPKIKKRCVHLTKIYDNIVARCTSPNHTSFYNYGGRGIRCDMTKHEFVEMFYLNELVDDPGYEFDRIDNDGNYSKDNIRLVTCRTNSTNRVYNSKLSYSDVAKRLITKVSITGINLNEDVVRLNQNECYQVKFPLTNRTGSDLCLFIHKSLDNYKYYVDRIISFYGNFGTDITYGDLVITQPHEEHFVKIFKTYVAKNNIQVKSLKTFYDVFVELKVNNPYFDYIDPEMLYKKLYSI